MIQFVLVDGRIFRSREKHLEITEACHKYVAADKAEELAAKIFSEAGASARIARSPPLGLSWKMCNGLVLSLATVGSGASQKATTPMTW